MPDFDEADFLTAMENGVSDIDNVENQQETTEQIEVVTEQPAAEVETPAVETETETPAAATPSEPVIKEVEVIKEVYPEFKTPESEALYKAWLSGDKDAVRNYIRESEKDYTTMSDLDVRREGIKMAHPNWTAKDIELEIRHTYGKDLELIDTTDLDKDDEEYTEAVAHNRQVEKNLELLAVHARDDRYSLIDKQSKIELPKIKEQEQPVAVSTQPTPEQIAEQTAKWVKNVEENMPKLSGIKQNIDGKEVSYDLNEEDKTALTSEMKNFNIFEFGKTRGWYNEDGTPNVLKLAEDVQKLTNFEKITKSFATQVGTATTKQVIKSIKNIDHQATPSQTQAFNSLEDAFYQSKQQA